MSFRRLFLKILVLPGGATMKICLLIIFCNITVQCISSFPSFCANSYCWDGSNFDYDLFCHLKSNL